MSVIVKGMEMPEKCGLCDLFHAESPMHCTVVKGHKTVGAPYGIPRPEWCPLVALPDKHGRLVDADALRDRLRNLADDDWNANTTTTWSEAFSECDDMVDDAPTIVESEDGT
jgi:hypothetical protein